jgi:hypothetical protein
MTNWLSSSEDIGGHIFICHEIYFQVSSISCGLARPRSLVGGKPTQVAVSHGPVEKGMSINLQNSEK